MPWRSGCLQTTASQRWEFHRFHGPVGFPLKCRFWWNGNCLHGNRQTEHIRLMALCPWLPRWASTRKVKPIWILLKQETASVGGISWAICKPAPRSRQITTSAPHHSVFYRLGALPAAQPTASKHWRQNWQTDYFCYFLEYNFLSDSLVSYEYTFACLFMHVSGWRCSLTGLPLTSTPLRQKKEPVFFCVRLFF